MSIVKGLLCSISGSKYENRIMAVCRQLQSPFMSTPFCTSDCGAGSTADIDIKLNWKAVGDIGVEAKRPSPDWMQMKLSKNAAGKWVGVKNPKIPEAAQTLFEEIIGSNVLFNGRVPSFLTKKITHADWLAEKSAFRDVYLECNSETISNLYKLKGCQYIQIAGKGLFHTGDDLCGFGVPYFKCNQRIRIRIKVHGRSGSGGFASLSVMAAAQPLSLKTLAASSYSLDILDNVPIIIRR